MHPVPASRLKTAAVAALAFVILFDAVETFAQASRLGPTFLVSGGSFKRRVDVGYDRANDVYVVVNGINTSEVTVVSADGAVLAGPVSIGIPSQSPFIACNDVGICLVTLLNQNSVDVWGQLVTYVGPGSLTLGTPFPIGATGAGIHPEVGAAVTYSTTSDEFFVVWRQGSTAGGGVHDLHGRRVSHAGQLLGSEIIISQDNHLQSDPHLAYNPVLNEYAVAYFHYVDLPTNAAWAYLRRIDAATGALLSVTVVSNPASFMTLPQVTYNTTTNQYFVGWYQIVGSTPFFYGRLVQPDGTLPGSIFPIVSGFASYDGFGLAYNPASNRSFAIFHGSGVEDAGLQVDAAGVPDPVFTVTKSSDVVPSSIGGFNPRLASHATRKEWLVATVSDFARTIGQRVQTLSAGGGGGGGTPSLTIQDKSVVEGDSGTVIVSFTVTLANPDGTAVTVNYATANGTATAGSDYVASNGTLIFPDGVTTQNVDITVNGDTDIEPNETLFINLSDASNATIADNQGVGTIVTDDVPPAPAVSTIQPGAGPASGNTAVTITGLNFQAGATVRIGSTLATSVVVVNSTRIDAVTGAHASGPADVVVTNPDAQSGTLAGGYIYTVAIDLSAANAPVGSWFFADGERDGARGVQTVYAILNEHGVSVNVRAYIASHDGNVIERQFTVPAISRHTVDLSQYVGAGKYAAVFQSTQSGRQIYVTRRMNWNSGEASHGEHGTRTLSQTWHFPFANLRGRRHTVFTVFNPSSTQDATVTFTFFVNGQAPTAVQILVPRQESRTIAGADLPDLDGKRFATRIDSTMAVLAERGLYRPDDWHDGSTAIGAASTSDEWYFGEGRVADGFKTLYQIFNPNGSTVTVNAVFQRDGALPIARSYQVAPTTRDMVNLVTEIGATGGAAARFITADGSPIVVERILRWGSPVLDSTSSLGATSAAASWVLPDGSAAGNDRTYVYLANPNAFSITARLTLIPSTGGQSLADFVVPADQRVMLDMNNASTFPQIAGKSFSVLVQVLTANGTVVAEQSVFSIGGVGAWKAGTTALGISR